MKNISIIELWLPTFALIMLLLLTWLCFSEIWIMLYLNCKPWETYLPCFEYYYSNTKRKVYFALNSPSSELWGILKNNRTGRGWKNRKLLEGYVHNFVAKINTSCSILCLIIAWQLRTIGFAFVTCCDVITPLWNNFWKIYYPAGGLEDLLTHLKPWKHLSWQFRFQHQLENYISRSLHCWYSKDDFTNNEMKVKLLLMKIS